MKISERTGRSVNLSGSHALVWLGGIIEVKTKELPLSFPFLDLFKTQRWRYLRGSIVAYVKGKRLYRKITWLVDDRDREARFDSSLLHYRLRREGTIRGYKWARRDRRKKALQRLMRHLNNHEFAEVETKRVLSRFPAAGIKAKNRWRFLQAHLALNSSLMCQSPRPQAIRAVLFLAIILGDCSQAIFARRADRQKLDDKTDLPGTSLLRRT